MQPNRKFIVKYDGITFMRVQNILTPAWMKVQRTDYICSERFIVNHYRQNNIFKLHPLGKDQPKDLLKFLEPFDDNIKYKALWLREFVWDLCPKTNELIYDNYNALAWGWSPTDKVGHTFCSIAVGRTSKNVHFGFYWGNEIPDPRGILMGNGNQYRYILVEDIKGFPKTYMKKLVKDAYANSLAKVKDKKQLMEGKTIVKSISSKKRELKAPLMKKKTGRK